MDLELEVAKQTKYKLRDFVKFMASGVTPKITEYDKYYCDSSNGIPFLRVQNLSPEGLDYSDCKYINKETHNNLLRRSQVSQGDLLIKITGVGRMAITSIAPEGFEGNINQHIVVVKTKEPRLNEQIAAFLNSNIGEMLAAHRSTGGTRPALDYTALRSIPIILNDSISNIMNRAYAEKTEKEKEAQSLLNSINDYLLQELGIVMPLEEENTLENRMFYVNSNKILGSRFDPNYYKGETEFNDLIQRGFYPVYDFHKVITSITNGVEIRTYAESGFRYLRVSDMGKNGIVNNNVRYVAVDSIPHKIELSLNDILISRSGSLGLITVVTDEIVDSILSSHIFRVRLSNKIDKYYLQEFLRSNIGQRQFFKLNNGGIIPEINQSALGNIEVCIPPMKKQKEIAEYIMKLRTKANKLLLEADKIIMLAKVEVEKILLG
ncbi:MAG: restriction endonuclease subunit S [Lachnospiraceae bacterium]|nr:restriction endonuclease subunit S [Lachnospiraceae bacterium]